MKCTPRDFSSFLVQVSSTDTIQQLKTRLVDRFNIPIHQQKLVLRGKTLHDGTLADHQIVDGAKLHLIVSQLAPAKPVNNALIDQLNLLAEKWTSNPHDREIFVDGFLKVNHSRKNFDKKKYSKFSFVFQEMKKTVDRLSLDEIERLCTDRLDPIN